MNTKAYTLPELTIYITDTCSMSCEGCITFNDLARPGGHLLCAGPALERMEIWSRIASVDHIFVIGGEPLSHPELDSWLETIQRLWPRATRYTIVTNGELLPTMTDAVSGYLEQGWDLEVSSHSESAYATAQAWFAELAQQMESKPLRNAKVEDGEETLYFMDSEGRPLIQIGQRLSFYPPRYTAHDDHIAWKPLQDQNVQHSLCPGKSCTHLVNGVMYRCPVQATIPRLNSQYRVEGTEGLAQRDLGFDPLEGGMVSSWIRDLGKSQSQCSLCDWNAKKVPLQDPYAKKIKITRQPK